MDMAAMIPTSQGCAHVELTGSHCMKGGLAVGRDVRAGVCQGGWATGILNHILVWARVVDELEALQHVRICGGLGVSQQELPSTLLCH